MTWQIGVAIPVADEAEHLGQCLLALHTATALLTHLHPATRVRIVVVLDDCHDASEQVAAGFDVDIVHVDAHNVGAARSAGTVQLLRAATSPDSLWLANTDADSQVPRDWLVGMFEHARTGADLVLGTVTPGPGLAPDVAAAWHAHHLLDDGHPHVHGANFGIRGDAYVHLGGWPELVSGEDDALAARAETAGMRIVRTARLPVLTSTRLTARAPYGFSSYLRGLAASIADG